MVERFIYAEHGLAAGRVNGEVGDAGVNGVVGNGDGDTEMVMGMGGSG